jgi:hypothetical protein
MRYSDGIDVLLVAVLPGDKFMAFTDMQVNSD